MLTPYQAAELLLKIEAVTFRQADPHRYESGLHSPIYVDCKLLQSDPNARTAVIDSVVEAVRETDSPVEVVVSTGVSGMWLSGGVARRLGLPMGYVRREPKSYGLGKPIEGAPVDGRRVLLVSDIISTSEDIPASVRIVRECGGSIARCQAVFDMQVKTNDLFLAEERVPYGSLSRLSDLLPVAEAQHYLTRPERLLVEDWHRTLAEWDVARTARLNQALERNKRLVSETLVRTNAVRIRVNPPFDYAAGGKGPIYTDNRILLNHPREQELILKALADMVVHDIGRHNFDAIAAVATGGIPFAEGVADELHLPHVTVKAKERDPNKMIEGLMKPGARVLLIEDLVNRGQSMLAAAAVVRNAGATITTCLAVLSYGLAATADTFRDQGLPLKTLCDLGTLLSVGVETGIITAADRATVQGWADAPDTWASSSR